MTSVLWRMRSETSLEHCRLTDDSNRLQLQGNVVARWDGEPLTAHYELQCTPDWRTQRTSIEILNDSGVSTLQLTADELLRWWRDGNELREFRGLSDIDLQISPCTNTLPIRRLNLGFGESASVSAVWVRFPELKLERLHQQYTRISKNQYHYESAHGAFRADLEVDDHGLIVRYGDLWERI